MRLFQFVKWWWDKKDLFERTFTTVLVIGGIPSLIASIWVAEKAILIFIFVALSAIAGWALYGLFCAMRNTWNKFVDENPSEEVAIMRKLKGIPTPSRQEVYHD